MPGTACASVFECREKTRSTGMDQEDCPFYFDVIEDFEPVEVLPGRRKVPSAASRGSQFQKSASGNSSKSLQGR